MNNNFNLEIRALILNKKGRVEKEYPWKKACCLIKAFMQVFYAQAAAAEELVKDTSGVNKAATSWGSTGTFVATLNDTTLGIVIGSGTTPVAMADFKLQTQLTTNIAHAAQTIALENPDSGTWRTVISRSLTNNTGAVLSIKEVALYGYGEWATDKFCYDRTLYSVDVPVGKTINLTYKFTITL